MPSLSEVYDKNLDRRTTWEKLYASMCARAKNKKMTQEELDVCVRLTPSLRFLPGTTLERVLRVLQEQKMIKLDKKGKIKILELK